MKTFQEIYEGIVNKFYNYSKLDIEPGTAIDSYALAASDGIKKAYDEIEASKDPHIFTNLKGNKIDSTGLLVNCPRQPNEDDQTYLYRVMNWTLNNQAANKTAIENALINLTYASNASFVPLIDGVGTGTVFIIPKSYDNDGPSLAINEVKEKIKKAASPGSRISYTIPKAIGIKLVCTIGTSDGTLVDIEKNIEKKVKEYINSIPPGSTLSLGDINKIGIKEANVEYFNTVQLYVDDSLVSDIEIMQKIDSKFLYDSIIWWTVM